MAIGSGAVSGSVASGGAASSRDRLHSRFRLDFDHGFRLSIRLLGNLAYSFVFGSRRNFRLNWSLDFQFGFCRFERLLDCFDHGFGFHNRLDFDHVFRLSIRLLGNLVYRFVFGSFRNFRLNWSLRFQLRFCRFHQLFDSLVLNLGFRNRLGVIKRLWDSLAHGCGCRGA